MPELTPLLRDQRKVDANHLKLIAVFHFVLSALSIVGLGFLFLHWLLMHSFFERPEMWKAQKGGPSPAEFFAIFKWFYAIGAVFIVTSGVANLVSGILIQRRSGRVFSLVVAGLNCLAFPVGTVLGIFTFLVLLRPSVEEVYESRTPPSPCP
jgi:hypothetical protein